MISVLSCFLSHVIPRTGLLFASPAIPRQLPIRFFNHGVSGLKSAADLRFSSLSLPHTSKTPIVPVPRCALAV